MTGTSNISRIFEVRDGKTVEVLRCRNGHEHTGDYAIYDYAHCQCDHGPLLLLSDHGVDGLHQLLCGSCGLTFELELEQGGDYSALIRKLSNG